MTIRNKFAYRYVGGILQRDWTWDNFEQSMREYQDGEIIVRKRIVWDVDKMNRFFHGPVLDFLRSQLKQLGIVFTKQEVKVWAKEQFLDRENKNGIEFLRSIASLDRDSFISLLKDIDEFCMDRFQCGLPQPEEVE